MAPVTGVLAACEILNIPRSTLYRGRQPPGQPIAPPQVRLKPTRSLSDSEKAEVRAILDSERFQDQSPREIYATLLDEGDYFCHWRTMYRVLAEHDEVGERRNQRQHIVYAAPELLATGPNQVWCWDITRLRGPVKWTYFYLYVMLDIFSRYAVGWMVAEQESAQLGQELAASAYTKQEIQPGQLTIHADRGAPMKAKSMALLFSDLGVNKSHSRPQVSNDNPFSEAQFRTLKYQPDYPDRFGSLVDSRQWCQEFFPWYNQEHHHTGLALFTPADVHYGRVDAILAQRQAVMDQIYLAHPERFVKGPPLVPAPPVAAWINPPKASDPVE